MLAFTDGGFDNSRQVTATLGSDRRAESFFWFGFFGLVWFGYGAEMNPEHEGHDEGTGHDRGDNHTGRGHAEQL